VQEGDEVEEVDEVEKIHFTTDDKYNVHVPGANGKKIFTCYLTDPDQALPEKRPPSLSKMPLAGDYILVKATTIKDTQSGKASKRYSYVAVDEYILTQDYERFDEAHTHTHALTLAHTRRRTNNYVHVHTYTPLHTYVHTNIHTHSPTSPRT
jgi:hypothetical protein